MGSTSHEFVMFAKRIGMVGATNLFLALQQLILIPILTKNISIQDYGVWVQITVTIGLIPSLVMLGLPYTMVRFLAAENTKKEIREGFYSITFVIFFTSLLTSFVLFIFADYLANLLFNGNIFCVELLAIIIFFECMISIVINIFRTFQQIKRYTGLLIFKNFLNLTLIALFISLHFGLTGAVVALLISDIVSFIVIYAFIFHEIGFSIPKFSNVREYLAFGIPTVPSNLSSWIVKASNRFIIGIFLGTAFVGYFNPGVQLANVIFIFSMPISFLLPATLSKYYDEQKPEKVAMLLEYSLKFLLLVAIPAAFGLAVLSKPVLMLISTPDIANQGYLITPIIAFGEIFMCVYIILMQVFILEKKTMITAKIWIFAAIFNIILNILLVPLFGINGAAMTYFFTFLMVLSITFVISRDYILFNLNLDFIGKYLTASIIMSALSLIYSPKSMVEIGIYICISIAIYSISLFILNGIKKEEIMFMRKLCNI